jgi:signal transduction histidine kinase
VNSDGKVSYCSSQDLADLEHLKTLFTAKDWKKILKIFHSSFSNESAVIELDFEILLNQQAVWHLCKIACLNDCEGEDKEFLVVLENIHSRIEREERLIKAREEAEAQEKIKSSFLANMSHEIRTPMNSIIGFSDLIQRTDNEEEKNQYLDIIKSSGQFLMNIINDIIDISKIEAGLLDIKVQRININELIKELSDIFRSDTRLHKDVLITNHLPLKNGDAVLLTDGTRMRQVLSNLMDNAVKFTSKGTIEIGYELMPQQKQDKIPYLRFFVKDSGIGIPNTDLELIFDRYHQVREGDESRGSGLGLTIVDALVKKLGGGMKVVSEVGKGSEFSFEIAYLQRNKRNSSQSKSPLDMEAPELKGRHILIAEDVDANYRFVAAIMRKTHAKLSWVKNGKEAVEFMLSNDQVDLVLMDLRMPVMDGYKASEHIKTLQPKVPIIALTAYAVEGDMEKALEAGCDDYLSKPIHIPDFYSKLHFYLNL